MPEWKPEMFEEAVRRRLVPLHLTAAAESDLVVEIAQHLEDRFRELCVRGAGAKEAAEGRFPHPVSPALPVCRGQILV